jgi:uncharacterized protein (DUF427 family)
MTTMKIPGPDYPITFEAAGGRVRATYQGHVIADSADVVMLHESRHEPVAYFPRDDVDMGFLGRTDHSTYCPYKGHASYFTLTMDGVIGENVVWTYEDPYPAMERIRGRLAFYPAVDIAYEPA